MVGMEKLEGSQVKLTFDITEEQLETAMSAAYHKNVKRYSIPGFRKGKAPRSVIENMYGKLVFFEDAFESIWPSIVDTAIVENNIDAVDNPQIDIEAVRSFSTEGVELPEGIAVRFTATVPVMPEVELGEYKGIEAHKHEYTVTDEMVDAEIDKMRNERASVVSIERAIENGDVVTLDYSGSIDGVKFEGGTAEKQELEIGSGKFIPGFEEQIIGMNIGDDKDITVTFPAEYHAEELAGKEAVFAIHIHDASTKILMDADDVFAQEVSEFESLAELRADIKQNLEKSAEQRIKNDFEDEVLGKVVGNAKFDVPQAMINRETESMLRDMDRNFQQQGFNLDMYLKITGSTVEQLAEQLRPEAEKRIRTRLVLEAIVKAENIIATGEEVTKAIDDFVADMNDEAKANFKEKVDEGIKGYFEDKVKIEKAISLVVDSAKVTE